MFFCTIGNSATYLDFTVDPPEANIVNNLDDNGLLANIFQVLETENHQEYYVGLENILDTSFTSITGDLFLDNDLLSGTSYERVICPVPNYPNHYYYFSVNAYMEGDISNPNTTVNYSSYIEYSLISIDTINNTYEILDNLVRINENKSNLGLELIRKYGEEEYWLLHVDIEENGVRRYLIDENGISDQGIAFEFPDDLLVSAGEFDYHRGRIVFIATNDNLISIMDFDRNTGLISNYFEAPNTDPITGVVFSPLGAEFSPDGSKLYYSIHNYEGGVYQYDFNTDVLVKLDIPYQATTPWPTEIGYIEMGPNGKLYGGHDFSLEIIEISDVNTLNPTYTSYLLPTPADPNIILLDAISEGIQPDVYPPEVSAELEVNGSSCSGVQDGWASLSNIEGMPPFSYQWNDPQTQTTASAINLSAGTYTVIVSDWYGTSDTIEVFVEAGDSLLVTEQVQNVSCYGLSNGAVELNIEGGTPPYVLNWYGYNPDELSPGVYNYEIIDSVDCLLNDSIEIYNPEAIVVESTIQEISCYGLNDGAIEVLSNGGTGEFDYSWTSNNGFSANTEDINGLPEGIYSLVLEDENDCAQELQISLLEPNPISIELLTVLNENCNEGGEASVLAQGDFAPFNYVWEDANSFVAEGEQIEQAASGWYEVIATDDMACESEALAIFIDEDQEPIAEFSVNTNEFNFVDEAFLFNNFSTAEQDLEIESYYWDFDDGMSSTDESPQHIFTQEGTYHVTLEVVDENGCSSTYSDFVTVMESEFSYIPNAFSPDGDQLNETFVPSVIGYDEGSFEFSIYDRWGKQFFYTQNSSQGWDGTQNGAPTNKGTYIYLVKYKRNSIPKEIQGTVLLLR